MKEENKCTLELFTDLTNNMIEEASSIGVRGLDAEKIKAIKECAQVVISLS